MAESRIIIFFSPRSISLLVGLQIVVRISRKSPNDAKMQILHQEGLGRYRWIMRIGGRERRSRFLAKILPSRTGAAEPEACAGGVESLATCAKVKQIERTSLSDDRTFLKAAAGAFRDAVSRHKRVAHEKDD